MCVHDVRALANLRGGEKPGRIGLFNNKYVGPCIGLRIVLQGLLTRRRDQKCERKALVGWSSGPSADGAPLLNGNCVEAQRHAKSVPRFHQLPERAARFFFAFLTAFLTYSSASISSLVASRVLISVPPDMTFVA